MGDIAEMMIDGTLCEGCGEYLGDGGGFSRICTGCEPRGGSADEPKREPSRKKRGNRKRKPKGSRHGERNG